MRKQFTFYKSFLDAMDAAEREMGLTAEQKAAWLEGIARYALYGERPSFGGILSVMWACVQPTLEAASLKSEGRRSRPAQDMAQEVAQDMTQEVAQEVAQDMAQEVAQQDKGKEKGKDIGIVQELLSSPEGSGDPLPPLRYEPFMAIWNSSCGTLPKIISLSADRKRKLKTRVAEWGGTQEEAERMMGEIMERIRRSDFLSGRTERWRGATFDWLISGPGNWRKVEEGNYENAKGGYLSAGRDMTEADFLKGLAAAGGGGGGDE